MTLSSDPHGDTPVLRAGVALGAATGALILLHGRGASAIDILSLGGEITAEGLALLAPEAAGASWYPKSFLAPVEENEPWLSSALRKIEALVAIAEASGVPAERIAICGFSQGACLASEFVARHPRRYAALIAFTGGLIGPRDTDLRHAGEVGGMPALFSTGDPDLHVPYARVAASAEVLRSMGAQVVLRRYAGRPHTVSAEEILEARALLRSAFPVAGG